MTITSALVILGGALAATWLALPRRIRLQRSVLIHAGRDTVWEVVRHFPALHARHSRLRALGRIDACLLRDGDGEEAGSLWRLYGRLGEAPYWSDLRILEVETGRRIVVTLERDCFDTHARVRHHRIALELDALSPGLTKATWTLKARLRGARIRLARVVAGERLRALLMDGGLRSLKVAIEGQAGRPADAAPASEGSLRVADAVPTPTPDPLGSPPPGDRRPPLSPS